jgi:hypothetical protein
VKRGVDNDGVPCELTRDFSPRPKFDSSRPFVGLWVTARKRIDRECGRVGIALGRRAERVGQLQQQAPGEERKDAAENRQLVVTQLLKEIEHRAFPRPGGVASCNANMNLPA